MARVLALIPDLLFGSQVQGELAAAGYEVELTGSPEHSEESLAGIDGASRPGVLIVDLACEEFDGFDFIEQRAVVGALTGTRTLGFYPHVNGDMRIRAEQAGIDLVVPRSRMAREGAALVAGLLN